MVARAAALSAQQQQQQTAAASTSVRLIDSFAKNLVDDIFAHSLKKQTGVSLKYMLDFGNNPIDRQLLLSAQFLHKELPVRLAHRVAELENLPYGLSAKRAILQASQRSRVLCVRVGSGRGRAPAPPHVCTCEPACCGMPALVGGACRARPVRLGAGCCARGGGPPPGMASACVCGRRAGHAVLHGRRPCTRMLMRCRAPTLHACQGIVL